jgi:hypothetical protein
MRNLAKRLLAGTSVAIALSAAANAQAQTAGVENVQNQQGGVFAEQTLDVVDPDGGVSAVSAATANGLTVNAEVGDVSLRSSQVANGTVTGEARVKVHGWTPSTVVSATAVGNAGDAVAHEGSLEAGVRQSVGYVGPVWAGAYVAATPSTTVDTSASATAIGNTHGFYAGHTAGIAVVQKNHSQTEAGVFADIPHVDGQADLAATALANSVSTHGGATALEVWQDRDAGKTGAYIQADVRNGQTVNASTRATANSLSAVHDAPYLSVLADQRNDTQVQAATVISLGQFGSVNASAEGVGNSIHAGAYGEEVNLDTTQFNGGSIEAVADFTGGEGYDANLSATAIGNTVAGFACSNCDATLDARNNQANHGDVSAVSKAWVHGGSRAVHSNATAVGNNAAYHVTRPGH